jgi:hypothetical protein
MCFNAFSAVPYAQKASLSRKIAALALSSPAPLMTPQTVSQLTLFASTPTNLCRAKSRIFDAFPRFAFQRLRS